MTFRKLLYFRFFQVDGNPHQKESQRMTPFRRTAMGCVLLIALALAPMATAASGPDVPSPAALAEFQTGNFRAASETLEAALRREPTNAGAVLLLARSYYEMGNWDRAAAAAESAVRLDPSSAENHLWLGQAYGRQAERDRSLSLALKTRREFEKAVDLAPTNIDARRNLMQFYLEAPWIVGGSKEKARKQMEAIASLDPVEGELARARFDRSTGKQAAAAAEYRAVLNSKPNRVGPYIEAADFYVASRDDSGLNLAVEGAEAVNPADVRLQYYRGVARVLEGQRLAQAERDLKSYAAHAPRRDDPSRASALSWLGQLYERWGESHLAMLEYQAALQLDPNILLARQSLARLKGN
ncbi:MAG: tetratricopeptide repeat protein [Terriglobia bacterium]